MTDEKKTEKTEVAQTASDLTAEVSVPENEKELVMEAKIKTKQKGQKTKATKNTQKPAKNTDRQYSSTCVLTNTSQNNICLMDGDKFKAITIAPREIKVVGRDELKELLKNKMVQRFFDKGILTHNMNADDVSAHDAVVPEELKNPVERHEDGQNVKAEVKTYRKEGSVTLDLS